MEMRSCLGAPCKTVGLAYAGSNPTPATNYSPQYQQVSAVIRNLIPVSTASRNGRSANRSLQQGNCARAGFSLPVRPFPTDQCCVRLCHADLRERPTRPAAATRSSRRRRPPQYLIVGSADPLITDIWRTGSGQSKRFGEPLAVADGDGITRHPARTANHQGPGPCAVLLAHPVCHPWRGRAAVTRNPGNMTSKDGRPWRPAARDRPRPTLAVSRRRPASARRSAPATLGEPHAQRLKARPWTRKPDYACLAVLSDQVAPSEYQPILLGLNHCDELQDRGRAGCGKNPDLYSGCALSAAREYRPLAGGFGELLSGLSASLRITRDSSLALAFSRRRGMSR
jgi:hypothetical protein